MRSLAVAFVVAAVSAQLSEEEKDRLTDYVSSNLCESGFFGEVGDTDFTNVWQLLELDYWSYRPYKVTSCEDDYSHWVGTQITLANLDGDEFALDPLGIVDQGKCQTLTLTGPLDAVKAGFHDDIAAVNSIRFRKDGVTKTYGESNLNDKEVEWTFTGNNRFLGLHGTTTNGIVTGFSVISDMGSGGSCNKNEALAQLNITEDQVESVVVPDTVDFGDDDKKEEPADSGKADDQNCECISDNEIDQTRRNGNKVIIMTDDNGQEHGYSTAYGTACIAWDETLAPYCGENGRPLDDQPDFCPKAWCFINPDKCFKSDAQPSKYFPELTYSYSQCNSEDTYTGYDPDAVEEEEEAPATTDDEDTTASTGSGAISMVFTTAAMAVTTALMI